jgi:hypothetical protein
MLAGRHACIPLQIGDNSALLLHATTGSLRLLYCKMAAGVFSWQSAADTVTAASSTWQPRPFSSKLTTFYCYDFNSYAADLIGFGAKHAPGITSPGKCIPVCCTDKVRAGAALLRWQRQGLAPWY